MALSSSSVHRGSRWIRRGVALCALALLLAVAGPRLMAWLIEAQLRDMVASHLDARLEIGHLIYHFPWAVTAQRVALVTDDAGGRPVEIRTAQAVELQLARLPLSGRPLLIERLVLDSPRLRIVRTDHGILGRKAGGFAPVPSVGGAAPAKLSDMFRLRRFKLDAGQITYEDRTQPDTPPMVWRNLRVDLNTDPRQGALYDYNLVAANLPMLDVAAAGTMDIDELRLKVDRFGLKLHVDPQSPRDQLPGPVQNILRQHRIEGALTVTGTADVPISHPGASRYDVVVDLSHASGVVPSWDASIDRVALKLHFTSPSASPTTRPEAAPSLALGIELFEAASGDTSLHLEDGTIQVDQGRWRVGGLTGSLVIGRQLAVLPAELRDLFNRLGCRGRLKFTARAAGPVQPPGNERLIDDVDYEMIAEPDGLTLQPAGFDRPLHDLHGIVHFGNEGASINALEAVYGSDKLLLANCRLEYPRAGAGMRLQDIDGSVNFGAASSSYPAPLGKVVATLHPLGAYFVTGRFAASDYRLTISCQDAGMSPEPYRIGLSRVKLDLDLSPGAGTIRTFRAAACGGSLTFTGALKTGPVFAYQGTGALDNVGLKQLTGAIAKALGDAPPKVSGNASAVVLVSGTGPREGRSALDNFRASGQLEILDGDFWEVPVIKDIVSRVKVAREALTFGQAAATFEVFDRRVVMDKAAIHAPLLGIQGSGEVRFDGQIDVHAIGAPLVNWQHRLDELKIPLIGDIVGAIQKLLNTATENLLYEFRITGTVAHPSVGTIPTPILTDTAAKLFGAMLNPSGDQRLIDVIRSDKEPATRP